MSVAWQYQYWLVLVEYEMAEPSDFFVSSTAFDEHKMLLDVNLDLATSSVVSIEHKLEECSWE